MPKFHAKIIVKMKPNVPDDKSEALKNAIQQLFLLDGLSCLVGDVYYINFNALNSAEALCVIERIANELLIGENVQTYEIRKLEEL